MTESEGRIKNFTAAAMEAVYNAKNVEAMVIIVQTCDDKLKFEYIGGLTRTIGLLEYAKKCALSDFETSRMEFEP